MLKIGIIGATGYVGQELIRLLSNHPKVNIEILVSKQYIGRKLNDVYKNFYKINENTCQKLDFDSIIDKIDVLFLSLPHGISSKLINEKILEKVLIIDLSADFRFKEKEIYENTYGNIHENESTLKNAVYGLSEWNRNKIRHTKLIANPGCYATCCLLSILPLINENIINLDRIIIDAKSGVSGAGRSLNLEFHYSECNESIKAYKIHSHRHLPEMEHQIQLITGNRSDLIFTPHLIPMNRGILTTCYAKLNNVYEWNDIYDIFKKYYGKETFIRLYSKGEFPETKWVKGSNFFDLGFSIGRNNKEIILIGAIDNLIKGAAGQAIQNFNIAFGFPENIGLDLIPIFPI
ncbi:MAG: N-acetyl-gamma-glutamyl-phosphate reductase [Promethearchaeota archaeon]